MVLVHLTAIYGIPFLAMIFCLNLVSAMKAVKNDKPTALYTYWMVISLTIMVMSITLTVLDFVSH